MKGETVMSVNRRELLGTGAALAGVTILPSSALSSDPIKLGSILDTSGIFDAYGRPMDMAMRLAVDEINAAGGLLGRQIEVVAYDTQSDMALYSQYGQQLTRQDRVDVVHGGILSASREAIRQIMRRTNTLYFYNVLYEGGVCDRNIFINGVTPAQQVETLVPYAMNKSGKKAYMVLALKPLRNQFSSTLSAWVLRGIRNIGCQIAALEVDFKLNFGPETGRSGQISRFGDDSTHLAPGACGQS